LEKIDAIFTLADLNRFSGIPGVLYFLLFIRKWKSVSAIIFYILLISFLFDFGIYIYIKYIYPNSYFGSNCWKLLNYALMSWFFFVSIPQLRRLVYGCILLFYSASIISFITTYSFWEANTVLNSLGNFLLLTFTILSFRQLLKRPSSSLRETPSFWILLSFLFYFSLIFLKGIFMNFLVFQLQIESEQFFPISLINLLANTSKNYILFFALVLIDKGYEDPLLNKS